MVRRRALILLLAGFFALLLGIFSAGAPAHAQTATTTAPLQVVSTVPADGDILNAAPAEIVLNFAETLPDISALIQLVDSQKRLLKLGQPIAFNNRMSLKVRVLELNGLPAGTYQVIYAVQGNDKTTFSGKFTFSLEAAGGSTADSGVTDTTEPATIETGGLGLTTSNYSNGFFGYIGRLLGYIGLAGLAGALLLIALAWAEGVEYVLTVRHLILMWALGTVGDLMVLGCLSADRGGTSFAKGLLPTSWSEAFGDSYGKAVVIRFLAMAASVWVARHPERVVDNNSNLMALAGPGVAILTYGWSRHPETIISAPFGALHMLGVSAWLGGALLLTRVVLAGPGEADLVTAVRKFRGIALPALGLTVLTGVVETALRLGGPRNLLNTGYGKIFILKMFAVAAMAFIGTANRQFAHARLSRSRSLPPGPAQRLRKSVRNEVAIGIFVLVLTGWLVGVKAPDGASTDPGSTATNTYVSEDGSFKAEVTFGPRKVGAQVELHFRLLKPESIKNGLITLTPNDVNVESFEIPIEGTPNFGFGPDQGFVFPASGAWTITITGTGPDGELPPITARFDVANQDGTTPTPTSSTSTVPTSRETLPPETTPPTDSVATP